MEIIELKNIKFKIKNSLDYLKNTVTITKDKISEHEDRLWKFAQWRKINLKKEREQSVKDFWDITDALVFVSSKSQGRRNCKTADVFEEIII